MSDPIRYNGSGMVEHPEGEHILFEDYQLDMEEQERERAAVQARYEKYVADCYACTPYLKDGETPAECIQRNRKDVTQLLWMLAKERELVEQQASELAARKESTGWKGDGI